RYGFRCCHLKNIWTAPLPPETELSRQMTTSTTSIDIMGLQAAYANLHTDQERDNPTYQAGLRRDAVQPDIEAERKKRDEIEAGKSYCSRRFGGATCDDKSAQIYARFDKN